MIKLECNTTNVSFNEEEEDWDLVTNDQPYDKTSRKHQMKMALVDGGANGGIVGTADSQPWDSDINGGSSVKVTSLGEHTVSDVPIKAVCAVSNSLDGSVLCIYHNYATAKIQSTTIHLKIQLQDHNNTVDDTILMVGGGQALTTPNGYIFPLTMKNGLCYLEQQKPTVWEMKELPRQVMTSIKVWDQSKYKKVGGAYDLNNDKNKLGNNIPPTPMDYSQLPQLISKTVKEFSTNIDETNTSNSDEELTSNHRTNVNNVRSATFSHPAKITIMDGNTGNIISEVSLHSTNTVTLHNIGDKTASPPPFPNIDTKEVAEQQMPLITTSLKDMANPITRKQRYW